MYSLKQLPINCFLKSITFFQEAIGEGLAFGIGMINQIDLTGESLINRY